MEAIHLKKKTGSGVTRACTEPVATSSGCGRTGGIHDAEVASCLRGDEGGDCKCTPCLGFQCG